MVQYCSALFSNVPVCILHWSEVTNCQSYVCVSPTPQMCLEFSWNWNFPSFLEKMGGSCHMGFPFPSGPSCEEWNRPLPGSMAGLPTWAASSTCQAPPGSLGILEYLCSGAVRRKAGQRLAFLPWCHPCVWDMNQSLASLVVWRVSGTFARRSQVNSVLLCPLHELQSVSRHRAKCLVGLPEPLGRCPVSCSYGFPRGSFSVLFVFSLF